MKTIAVSVAALVAAIPLTARVSSALADDCNGGRCDVKVTVRLTGSDCTSDDITVDPDPVNVAMPNNIFWTIQNDGKEEVKFPTTNAIRFKGTPEMPPNGIFGPLQRDGDKRIHVHDKPRLGRAESYGYTLTVLVNSKACSKDPTIANSGSLGPPPEGKGPGRPRGH